MVGLRWVVKPLNPLQSLNPPYVVQFTELCKGKFLSKANVDLRVLVTSY